MSKRNIIITISSFFAFLIIWGCKKGYDESTFEKYQSGSASTLVVDSLQTYSVDTIGNVMDNPTSVDFTQEYMAFEASINEAATWYIDIVDFTSGATKRLSGFGTDIDSSQVKWYGDSDNIYYFSKNDSCAAIFSVLGTDIEVRSTSFMIEEQRLDSSFILVADFEPYVDAGDPSAGRFCEEQLGARSQALVKEWNKFFDTENRDEEVCGGYVFTNSTASCNLNNACGGEILPAVNGVGYFYLKGIDYADEPNNFFVGGFNHDAVLYNIDPDKELEDVWVNFYANSNGNGTTSLKLKVYGIGGDEFSKEFEIDWNGWKLVKINLGDLALENTGPNSPGSLIIGQIKRMGFEVLCSQGAGSGCNIEAAIDYVTITYDRPFNPQLTY